MMISPECFAEERKGSSLEELIKERNELYKDILSFEKNPENVVVEKFPSPEVIYQMNLLYLAKVCELIVERKQID